MDNGLLDAISAVLKDKVDVGSGVTLDSPPVKVKDAVRLAEKFDNYAQAKEAAATFGEEKDAKWYNPNATKPRAFVMKDEKTKELFVVINNADKFDETGLAKIAEPLNTARQNDKAKTAERAQEEKDRQDTIESKIESLGEKTGGLERDGKKAYLDTQFETEAAAKAFVKKIGSFKDGASTESFAVAQDNNDKKWDVKILDSKAYGPNKYGPMTSKDVDVAKAYEEAKASETALLAKADKSIDLLEEKTGIKMTRIPGTSDYAIDVESGDARNRLASLGKEGTLKDVIKTGKDGVPVVDGLAMAKKFPKEVNLKMSELGQINEARESNQEFVAKREEKERAAELTKKEAAPAPEKEKPAAAPEKPVVVAENPAPRNSIQRFNPETFGKEKPAAVSEDQELKAMQAQALEAATLLSNTVQKPKAKETTLVSVTPEKSVAEIVRATADKADVNKDKRYDKNEQAAFKTELNKALEGTGQTFDSIKADRAEALKEVRKEIQDAANRGDKEGLAKITEQNRDLLDFNKDGKIDDGKLVGLEGAIRKNPLLAQIVKDAVKGAEKMPVENVVNNAAPKSTPTGEKDKSVTPPG